MDDILTRLKGRDFTNDDMVVVVVMSHGGAHERGEEFVCGVDYDGAGIGELPCNS